MVLDGFKDYFKILGVNRNATGKEIISFLRKLSKKFHPDFNQNYEKVNYVFKEINEAY